MTIPIAPTKPGAERKARAPLPAAELSVPIGPRVVEVLDLAYRARRPVLLEGATGIGKSQIVSDFARASGLDVLVLDLSLLEPPDLVGLPVIEGGRTHYATPAELPRDGRGVLMLEELNRAEIPVMQPALQLLSARRLHGYELPAGWTCVAAINPEDGDYQVNRLDPALRSRFLQLSVCAEQATWLAWAARANVHPVITRIVREHEDAFEQASPRSWAYASELLHVLRPDELASADLVRVALRGYLATPWAMLVTDALGKAASAPAIDVTLLLGPQGDAALARAVRELEGGARIDSIAMLASRLRRALAGPELVARVEAGELTLAVLEKRLAPLPGDLREQCLESAVRSPAAGALARQLGHAPETIMTSYATSPLKKDVDAWRREMKLHRIELVITAVTRWAEELGPDRTRVLGASRNLALLAADAGPIGADLARWLRARDLESTDPPT